MQCTLRDISAWSIDPFRVVLHDVLNDPLVGPVDHLCGHQVKLRFHTHVFASIMRLRHLCSTTQKFDTVGLY